MDEIAQQALSRIQTEQDFAIEVAAGKEISAARALGDELDRLEALAAELLTVRNRVRVKARSLHTSRQVGDAQTSEAELVSAPLQRQIVDLKEHVYTCEQEIIRLTKALEAERRQSAQNMAGDHQIIVEQRQRIEDLGEELETYRKHHVCTEACRPNAHVAFTGKGLVKELEQRIRGPGGGAGRAAGRGREDGRGAAG